mmetsp:Transcript_26024/g.65657  ORF Transcript_26024/g.65657 Transcript_26024/m.65657 type:complete len:216 (+) Transcript_26024:2-649(+)
MHRFAHAHNLPCRPQALGSKRKRVSISSRCMMTIRMPSANVTKARAMAAMGSAFQDHSFWFFAATPMMKRKTKLTTEATKACQTICLFNFLATMKRKIAWITYTEKPHQAKNSITNCASLSMFSWSLYQTFQNLIFRKALKSKAALLMSMTRPIVMLTICSLTNQRLLSCRSNPCPDASSGSEASPVKRMASMREERRWEKACMPMHHRETPASL